MTEQQRDLEDRAGKIIWEAAGLRPGIPGHAVKTAGLVERMRQLIREAQESARTESVLPDGVDTPPVNTPPALTEQDRERLLRKYAPSGGHR